MSSGILSPFIDLYVPALTPRRHCSEAALQLAENTTFTFLCRVNIGIVREQGKTSSRCREDIIFKLIVQYWSKDGTLRHPCRYISWRSVLSDVLNGLLPSDGPGIVDAGASLGCRGNVFTGRSLAIDEFSWPAVPPFSLYVTIFTLARNKALLLD
jgi:hypothetical protein